MDTYYNPEDLAQFGNMGEDAPELWEKFMAYYGQVFEDGALSAREKCLICLLYTSPAAPMAGGAPGYDMM